MALGLFATAFGYLKGAPAGRSDARMGAAPSQYDPDLECVLLQMGVLADVRMTQRAQELSAVGFERRQQGYEAAERQFDFILRCHSVSLETRQAWLATLMYALRCEVERQDLAKLVKRSAALGAMPTLALDAPAEDMPEGVADHSPR